MARLRFVSRIAVVGFFVCGVAAALPAGAQPFPTHCANEGSTCAISLTTDVAFGAGSSYIVLRGVRSSITCNTTIFGGDPAPGVSKACYVSASAPSQQGAGPAGYAACINENGTCTFSGNQDVVFGAAGQWVQKLNVASSIGCNTSAFGIDPAPGYAKACYIPNAQSGSAPMWYTFCASESGSCSFGGSPFPGGSFDVVIGANNRYFVQTITSWDARFSGYSSIPCDTNQFAEGDPDPGVQKSCFISFNSGPGGYKTCAVEYGTAGGTGTCQLPFSGDWVMFGPAREGGTSGNGTARLYAKTFSGSTVTCSHQTFGQFPNSGDPAPNYLKFCFTR